MYNPAYNVVITIYILDDDLFLSLNNCEVIMNIFDKYTDCRQSCFFNDELLMK